MADAISEDVRIPGDYSYRHWRDGDKIPPFLFGSTGNSSIRHSAMGYRESRPATHHSKKSVSGWRPPLPWNHTREVVYNPTVSLFSTSSSQPDYRGQRYGYVLPWVRTALPIFDSKLEDLAVNQVLSKLSNQQMDMGENLAEHQQVSDMIGGKLSNIADGVRNYKHRNPRDWRKVKKLDFFGPKRLGAIPNSWLEAQYGWIPLMLDIKGGFDLIKHLDSQFESKRLCVTGSRRVNVEKDYTSTSDNGTGDGGTEVKIDSHFSDEIGCYVRIDYAIENPTLHILQQIGLANPAALAWNLVPYTFVLDWVLPVGNYLQSWTATLGLRFIGGSISRFIKRTGQAVGIRPVYPQYYQFAGSISPGRWEFLQMNRRVLDDFPAPRLPHLKNPLSLRHFANGMSLLVSALK